MRQPIRDRTYLAPHRPELLELLRSLRGWVDCCDVRLLHEAEQVCDVAGSWVSHGPVSAGARSPPPARKREQLFGQRWEGFYDRVGVDWFTSRCSA